MILYKDTLQTPIGLLTVVADETAIKAIYFENRDRSEDYFRNMDFIINEITDHIVINKAKKQLEEYFNASREVFDLPLDPVGTDFQKLIWNILRKIPYGETWSYADLAEYVGNAKACRAAGNANGKNPIPIIIPCHRVIASDGPIGGFSGGLENKKALLSLEEVPISQAA